MDIAYNAVNQLTSLSRYSGVNSVVDTSYTYDLNQRLIQLSHKKGVSTIASYDYGYDNADKLASTTSSVDGTSSYSYDSTNQLTGASHSSQVNEAYSYDANGNRTSGGTVTGANNQLLSDGTYSYQYDGEGNRTRRTEIVTGKVTEYVWDYRNRLASVLFKDAGGVVTKTIDYIYDGNNQRIGKRIDGTVTERYVIDRNQIALVFDGNGVQTHRYLYGTQVDQVLADETATGMVWALADREGTVTDLIDNNGVVVNHITYDSFGKVQSQSNTGVGFRYGYTGREQDNETGLDYYRARYYDASNGRFISEDPIGFEAGDNNLTRYVGNNPVNAIDSSGLFGKVLLARRGIVYQNGTGQHQGINNILDVIKSRETDSSTSIIIDATLALIGYGGKSKLGSGTTATSAGNVPDMRTNVNTDLNDDAGHIIGNQLGGSGTDPNNLFAQGKFKNNRYQPSRLGKGGSEWRKFEDDVRKKIDQEITEIPQPAPDGTCPAPNQRKKGHRLATYSIILEYPRNSLRPNHIIGNATYTEPFPVATISPATPSFVNIRNLSWIN